MELITTYICKKGDIGVHDNMFGGTIMSLIDDEGKSLPIHQFVKDRYWDRMKVHGRGLLDAKEKNNDIYNKKQQING